MQTCLMSSRVLRPLQAANSTRSTHLSRIRLSICAKHALFESTAATVRQLAAEASATRTIAATTAAPPEAPVASTTTTSFSTLQQRVGHLMRGAAKSACLVGLAAALLLSGDNPAHAARTAGRAGGFSAPAPSASRSYGGAGRMGSSGFSSRGYSGGSIFSSPGSYR